VRDPKQVLNRLLWEIKMGLEAINLILFKRYELDPGGKSPPKDLGPKTNPVNFDEES
jgi:hypothetical protein